MNRLQRPLAITLLAVSAAALVACGGSDPDKLVASAKAYIAKDDHKAAILELKTALQERPDSAEARFLLGKSLLASGDVPGAALELRKALDLRHDENEVAPELARAMMLQGDFQRLLEQFGQTVLSQSLAEADLKSTLARANGALGRRDQARAAAEAALKAVADYGPATIFMARLQADTGDIDGALAAIDAQLKRTPQDAEGWQVKGELLALGKRDTKAALAAYRQSIAVKPNFFPAHSGAMNVLLGLNDLEGSRQQLAELQKVLPKHPQTVFYAASVALLGNETDKARELTQQLLRVVPDNPRVLQLAGTIEFERRNWLQASAHLSKSLQINPEQDATRRLLAMTYLQTSEPTKALSTLQPLLDRPVPPPRTLALKAQAHLQAGEIDEAKAAFAAAAKADPTDTRSKAAVAVGKLGGGGDESGLAELRSLAASDDGTAADMPLIGALIAKKDFKAALAAVDALEKKQPDKPVAANLRARILLAQGDKAGGEKAFRRALEIQPTFFPAAAGLAQLALADKRLDDALAVFEAVLKADPKNTQALISSASLKVRKGAPREEIVGMFRRAIEQSPGEVAPRLALVNYQLGKKEVKAALETAQQADAALPNNPAVLDALGRALAASGDTNQAVATFGKLSTLLPKSPAPHLRLADVHWAARNQESAIQSLKRALSIAPDSLTAQRSLIDAYVAGNRTAEAMAVARQIRAQRPNADVGYVLEGAIEATAKRWDRALEVYRAGLKAVPTSSELATRVHVALLAGKKDAEAKRHVEEWVRLHPKDAAFHFHLGDLALASGDLPGAESAYRKVIEEQPQNALALNNVAWIMATQKKPGSVVMAEKAVSLLPDRPAILDTLALAQAAEGQPAKGVETMRQALRLDEKNPSLRFNLAKLLIQSGDKAGAKAELDGIAQLGSKFSRQNEVAELLKTL